MFDRQSIIKKQAKNLLISNYATNVLVWLTFLGICLVNALLNMIPLLGQLIGIAAMFVIVVLLVGAHNVALFTFQDKTPQYTDFTSSFKSFGRNLGGQLWANLFLSLWSLLLFLPSNLILLFLLISEKETIFQTSWVNMDLDSLLRYSDFFVSIAWGAALYFVVLLLGLIALRLKALSYSMVPFLLCSANKVPPMDTLELSKKMTKGNIWELFLFDLSFIGWQILSMLTCGLLSILWVSPYYYASFAGIFLELKKLALQRGICTAEDFLHEDSSNATSERLTVATVAPQKNVEPGPAVKADIGTPLPVWGGFIIAGVFFIAGFFSQTHAGDIINWTSIFGIGGLVYYCICLAQIHKRVIALSGGIYEISVNKAVGYIFIPFYNIYWMFKWTMTLVDFINKKEIEAKMVRPLWGILMLSASLLSIIPFRLPLMHYRYTMGGWVVLGCWFAILFLFDKKIEKIEESLS